MQRYLDQDPSASLRGQELRRLEAHLATCEKCHGLAQEYRGISAMLARMSLFCEPDEEALARVQHRLQLAIDEERP